MAFRRYNTAAKSREPQAFMPFVLDYACGFDAVRNKLLSFKYLWSSLMWTIARQWAILNIHVLLGLWRRWFFRHDVWFIASSLSSKTSLLLGSWLNQMQGDISTLDRKWNFFLWMETAALQSLKSSECALCAMWWGKRRDDLASHLLEEFLYNGKHWSRDENCAAEYFKMRSTVLKFGDKHVLCSYKCSNFGSLDKFSFIKKKASVTSYYLGLLSLFQLTFVFAFVLGLSDCFTFFLRLRIQTAALEALFSSYSSFDFYLM